MRAFSAALGAAVLLAGHASAQQHIGKPDNTTILVVLALVGVCIVGYLLNIIRIFTGMGTARTAVIVVRVAGVFIPLIGIIAGFIANKPAED